MGEEGRGQEGEERNEGMGQCQAVMRESALCCGSCMVELSGQDCVYDLG